MQTRHIILVTTLLALTLINYAITSCRQNPAGPTPTDTVIPATAPSNPVAEPTATTQPATIAPAEAGEITLQPDPDSPGGIVMQVHNLAGNRDPLAWTMDPDTAAQGQVTLKNYTDLDMDLALTCFIDYLQKPCFDPSGQFQIRVDLPAGKQQTIHITIPPLNPGLHDLLIVAFYLPDLHLPDPRFREETRFMYSFWRTNLLVGQTDIPPAVHYQPYTTPDEMAAQGIYTLALTHENPEDPSQAPWQISEVPAGATTSFSLRWNNPQPEPATFALIGLLDYEQVTVAGDSQVLFGQLPPQGRADIAGQVTAPVTSGPHEFILLVIENPFTPLTRQATTTTPRPTFTYSSDRVLLQVP